MLPKNELRILSNNILVERFNIIGTQFIVYRAWEIDQPACVNGHLQYTHAVITHFHANDVQYGTISSRRDVYGWCYSHLPRGEERTAAVDRWNTNCNNAAYNAIIEAFPEAIHGTKTGGDIEVYYGEL